MIARKYSNGEKFNLVSDENENLLLKGAFLSYLRPATHITPLKRSARVTISLSLKGLRALERAFWLESGLGFPNQLRSDSTCWLGGGQQGNAEALFARLA